MTANSSSPVHKSASLEANRRSIVATDMPAKDGLDVPRDDGFLTSTGQPVASMFVPMTPNYIGDILDPWRAFVPQTPLRMHKPR